MNFDDGEHLLALALHFFISYFFLSNFFLLSAGNRSFVLFFHFVVRRGIKGRMLCRIKRE